jgi:xanthine dehydrogenase small subunit
MTGRASNGTQSRQRRTKERNERSHPLHREWRSEVTLGDFGPTETLLDYLRLRRRLTGTKEGCAEGDCGACTVLIGRLTEHGLRYESVNACIRFLGSLHGTHVVTVEHLAGRDGALHPVQQAMVDFHGSQCGFCTPGFVMSLYGLWLSNGTPTRADIESALQGNLCRCTGYEPIVKAAEHISVNRPSSLFDPLERDRIQIMAKLWGIHSGNDTTIITKDGARSIVPASVAAFADILADEPEATIVAGATDVGLWVTKQMRLLNPVIFINHLTELQSITSDETGITIGAGVSYTQAFDVSFSRDPRIRPADRPDRRRPGAQHGHDRRQYRQRLADRRHSAAFDRARRRTDAALPFRPRTHRRSRIIS